MTVTVEPGGTFAGYAVETVVGRGGMGIVYRAADVALGRPVALKLIAPEFADDERFRARFLRESRLAAGLDHPAVVPIYGAGEADGLLYLAMRYVAGGDLPDQPQSTFRRKRHVPEDRAEVGAVDVAVREI